MKNDNKKKNIPNDFDWKTYIRLNNDLNDHNNKRDAINHYLNYGINEKRQYKVKLPNDFNWEEYIALNSDLIEVTNETEAINHYRKYGFFQNRNYKKESKVILYDLITNKKIAYEDNLFMILNKIIKKKIKSIYNFVKQDEENFYKNNNLVFENTNYNKIVTADSPDTRETTESPENLLLYSSLTIEKKSCKKNIQNECIYLDEKFSKFSNIYESFILIIDLPENFYGGAKFFINSIIEKYRNSHTFLIFQSTENNLIKININNIFFFNYEYDVTTIKNILDKNQNKIKKIFINHVFFFPTELIKYLFILNKKISLVTHDHYLFNNKNKTQLMYYEIDNYIYKNDSMKYDLNLFENIITQNEKNLYLFNNFSHLKNITITELPDFKLNDETIITYNKDIVIGIIGYISDIKGSDFIKYLIKYLKDSNSNSNVKTKVVIFGKLSNSNYKDCHPYNNINELNDLLKIYKPNMLLECSLWPETYSYTLSLSMLTELPILILKKPFIGVVDDRIKNYKKKIYFDNLKDLLSLINDDNIKQNYFKTIKPVVYFNQFWNNYFTRSEPSNYDYFVKTNQNKIQETNNKNVFLITSKIYISDKQFTYIKKRSLYTPKERFTQTLKTFSTIRENIPDSFIVLFDNSKFTENEIKLLNESVDCFINITNNETLNYYTDDCEYKYLSDLFQQINSYYYFFQYIDYTKIKNFFKISGRYFINKKFNYSNYDNNLNIFKKNIDVKDREYYYTSFFKISRNFFPEYFSKLIEIFENKGKYFSLDLEVIYGECFLDNMSLINNLGITQVISCFPEISNI